MIDYQNRKRAGSYYYFNSSTNESAWEKPKAKIKALMHAGAELKNYVESFHFRAPSDASGDLVVRALVKQGETNRGAAAGPLALS